MEGNIFDDYLRYTEKTESPAIFHRWCMLTSISALLGRSAFINHGHSRIFPNIYCMLIGVSGSRKSTAIKMVKKLVAASGYDTFAADKTSKEKFLLDLEGAEDDTIDSSSKQRVYDRITERQLWGAGQDFDTPKEVFIVADEFNEFIGSGNTEFLTTLGNLWDFDAATPFTQRLKNSRSVSIYQPTVTILAGNTQENFARAFPTDIIGQGFFSRLLLIHGAKTGKKLSFPPSPSSEDTDRIVGNLQRIRGSNTRGAITLTPEAYELLDAIYLEWEDIDDIRFQSYGTRRFTYLLKLCLITMAGLGEHEIDVTTVIYANTVLSAAELLMPKALGEFGKSKNSEVVNKIVNLLITTSKPLSVKEVYTKVAKDLDKPQQLTEILQSLQLSGKAQFISGHGWLAKITPPKSLNYVDWSLLTEEERKDTP